MTINTNTATLLEQKSTDELKAKVKGQVFTPGDEGYDRARMAWNLSVSQYPAVVMFASDAADIIEGVRFARQVDLGVAVQATGHGVIRPANDCLLINTSQMNSVRVDPDSRTAWVEAGAKWGRVLEAASVFGLAPLLGSSPDVGAVGYTLGGGLGWLARKYGLSTDSVRAIDLVTADGQRVHASQDENSDLFWGLRGGGGGFGVVVGMEIQLYPVSTVFGGNLIYPVEMASDVIARYRDWIETIPDEFTTSFAIMNYPPLPMVPEFLRGKSFIMVRGCYCGAVEEGQAYLQDWLDWRAPVANMFQEMPFSQAATISNDPVDPVPGVASGAWLHELSDDAIQTLVDYGVSVQGSSPVLQTEVRHVGGAMGRASRVENAFGHRDHSLLLEMVGMAPTPEAKSYVQEFIGRFKDALSPSLTGGVYMNFLEGEEAHRRTRDGYPPEIYKRLMALKAEYDPENLFRFGFDIPPLKS
jgi:hypothetical protein